MNSVLIRFLDVCLLKAGPSDIPASDWLMKITLLMYFIMGVAINLIESSWSVSLLVSLGDLLVMIAVLYLLLSYHQLQFRFQQIMTTLAGTGFLLGMVNFPIILLFHQLNEKSGVVNLVMFLMLAMIFWNIMVVTHVFRRSIDIKLAVAVILTVLYITLSLFVTGLILSGLT